MEWLRGDAQMMDYEQSFVDAADTWYLSRKTSSDFSSYRPSLAHGEEPGAAADGDLPQQQGTF
jgi:hypothetical protein